MLHLLLLIIFSSNPVSCFKDGEKKPFGPDFENLLPEKGDDRQIFNSEQFETMFKEFKEPDRMKEIYKQSGPKETHTEKSESNNNNEYINDTTFPELLLLGFLGLFILLTLCLVCIGSKSCVERFLAGRQRLKKALQYRPSKYRSRVTPIPPEGQQEKEEFRMGSIFQIT